MHNKTSVPKSESGQKTTKTAKPVSKNNAAKNKNLFSCGSCGACARLSSPRLSSNAVSSALFQAKSLGKESCATSFMQKNYGNHFTSKALNPTIQKKCSCGASCKGEEEAEKVSKSIMRMPSPALNRKESINYKPSVNNNEQGTISEIMSHKGSGQNLDNDTRSFMESRFGHDFGQVKLHTDSYAAGKSNDLNAEAFTIGRDIFFNAGRFRPASTEGKGLLAHELTHVVQQRCYSNNVQLQSTPAPPCPSTCHHTAGQAVADVPAHVDPKDCFVWQVGNDTCPAACGRWQSMSGTGCAHWVAHQLGIGNGLTCHAGMSVRVGDVVGGRTAYLLAQAQVGDIWTNDGLSHTGIVRQIQSNSPDAGVPTNPDAGVSPNQPITTRALVQHDSSSQGGVISTWFTSGQFYR